MIIFLSLIGQYSACTWFKSYELKLYFISSGLIDELQTGLPMAALSVVGAQWRLKPQDRALLWSRYMPWALRAGAAAPDLLCLHYERHFEVPSNKLGFCQCSYMAINDVQLLVTYPIMNAAALYEQHHIAGLHVCRIISTN